MPRTGAIVLALAATPRGPRPTTHRRAGSEATMMAKARAHPPHPAPPAPLRQPAPRRVRARAVGARACSTSSEEVARAYLRFGEAAETPHEALAAPERDDLPIGGMGDQRVYQALDARHRARNRKRARAHACARDECP